MAEFTEEEFETLPDSVKEKYGRDGDGYSHNGFLKIKATADSLNERAEKTQHELNDYRTSEEQRVKDAELRAYEKAKSEGNTEEVETRLNQKIEDAERRAKETETQFQARMSKLADKQKNVITAEIAAKNAVNGGSLAYQRLLASHIEVSPETDEITYLDDDGRAMSLNEDGFNDWIKKNPLFEAITKAEFTTENGGAVNGSNNRGRASTNEAKNAEHIKNKDMNGFLKDNLKIKL